MSTKLVAYLTFGCAKTAGYEHGWLATDLTQHMSPEDAALVKAQMPFYHTHTPGPVVMGLMAHTGHQLASQLLGVPSVPFLDLLPGVGVGTATRLLQNAGAYDKAYDKNAKRLLEKAKAKPRGSK